MESSPPEYVDYLTFDLGASLKSFRAAIGSIALDKPVWVFLQSCCFGVFPACFAAEQQRNVYFFVICSSTFPVERPITAVWPIVEL